MEDRINSGLLFVMLDRAADRARGDWDERLRALPGVARISWWKNVQLNRRDWLGELRTLEDFEMLGICEIDDAIDPPSVSEGARSIVFRRYPRPSQGVLRLPTLGLSVVMISTRNPKDEVAVQSLRDWGDFVHFPASSMRIFRATVWSPRMKTARGMRRDSCISMNSPTRMPRPCFSAPDPVWRSASAAARAIPASIAGSCIPRFASIM